MTEIIPREWYVLQDVPRDGNCLFHAAAAQSEFDARELRALTWKELHHETYKHVITPPKTPNFSWMSVLGDVAPMALARAMKRTILVVACSSKTVGHYVHPREGRTDNPVYLYLNNGHYWRVRPREQLLRWEDKFYE